jgi:MinD-like ATPase involved in chromosome partitioning or flagellar assembly
VLIACWSPKGGSGTTVVACLLALVLARKEPPGALLADLGGDLPAALGIPEPTGPGLGDWLSAPTDVEADAVDRLEVGVRPSLALLPRGSPVAGAALASRADALAARLAADSRMVVADCGAADRGPGFGLAAGASLSLLVLRPCYLAVRRALAAPVAPTGIVLVAEPERALRSRDVEEVLGAPILAEVPRDPRVARAVDAGLLSTRIPRDVERRLERAVLALVP